VNSTTFNSLATFLRERSGLVLTEDKVYLLQSRLDPVARKWGKGSLDELALALRTDKDLATAVIDAMTTNESLFFRDVHPFEQMRTIILPELAKARGKGGKIRIWSAACSSGQEPYSISMVVADESQKLGGCTVEIVATDLSTEILARARAGTYTHFEVQRGLPIRYLTKYFKRDGDRWQIDQALRAMVRFEPNNLLEQAWPAGNFDVIFCRNVLIYFDQATKTRLLDRFAAKLPGDGFLFLGGAETAFGISNAFELLSGTRGIYRPAASRNQQRAIA
jgi:chemotaxis protein methyltransferase CheR